MPLIDYLIAARWGRVLGRLGFLAPILSAERLDQMRRLGHRESLDARASEACMNAAAVFWFVAAMVFGVLMVVGAGIEMVLSDPRHLTWMFYVPITVGLGAITWAVVLYGYALIRSKNIYDGVIAGRAGRLGNRVLSGMALPKPRDFWIATVLGLGMLAFMQVAFARS